MYKTVKRYLRVEKRRVGVKHKRPKSRRLRRGKTTTRMACISRSLSSLLFSANQFNRHQLVYDMISYQIL